MSAVTVLNTDEFETQVLKADKPAMVEFGASWCGPCKMLEPVLEELALELEGKVDFFTVNVDQNPELVMAHGVMGVPTVILFRDGQAVNRMTGYRPKKALEKEFFSDL